LVSLRVTTLTVDFMISAAIFSAVSALTVVSKKIVIPSRRSKATEYPDTLRMQELKI
jgi:hypothetical protein